uniref:Uncharacterized protein n=1 Tax=Panagrolaimus davidi TaxID=227884 RepID=A0A914P199_9BILA
MIIFQFVGIVIFVSIPVIVVISISTFVKESIAFVGYALTTISCFGIWDSSVTIYCITPYRIAVLEVFKRCCRNDNTRFNLSIVPMSPQNRLPSVSHKIEFTPKM